MELSPPGDLQNNAYKKIGLDEEEVDKLLVDIFLESEATPPKQIIVDVDATDDRYMATRRGVSFTVMTKPTAPYLSIFSVASMYFVPDYVPPVTMLQRVLQKS